MVWRMEWSSSFVVRHLNRKVIIAETIIHPGMILKCVSFPSSTFIVEKCVGVPSDEAVRACDFWAEIDEPVPPFIRDEYEL